MYRNTIWLAGLTLPGCKDLDVTMVKAFGLPKARVLGENGRIELRVDAYNVLNNLNLNPNPISNNINSNFGTITGALFARVVTVWLASAFSQKSVNSRRIAEFSPV